MNLFMVMAQANDEPMPLGAKIIVGTLCFAVLTIFFLSWLKGSGRPPRR